MKPSASSVSAENLVNNLARCIALTENLAVFDLGVVDSKFKLPLYFPRQFCAESGGVWHIYRIIHPYSLSVHTLNREGITSASAVSTKPWSPT